MTTTPDPLPIEPVIPALREALRTAGAAVLQAPPGAGKTTRVPLALLAEPWLAGRRLVMLEPRRLAARAAAHRMAQTLGEQAGGTVGYRIRHESRVGPGTRVEVVTEGVLTRMLQADPALEPAAWSSSTNPERSIHEIWAWRSVDRTIRRSPHLVARHADGGPVAALLGARHERS
jgi:ATP-dependent helicase HrpB